MYYRERMHTREWKRRREMIRWKGDDSLTRVADQEAKNSLAISLSLSLSSYNALHPERDLRRKDM